MQCDDAFRRDVNRLGPELEFGMDGAMKREMLRLSVKRADWRVMADLFAHYSITQLFPSNNLHTFSLVIQWLHGGTTEVGKLYI